MKYSVLSTEVLRLKHESKYRIKYTNSWYIQATYVWQYNTLENYVFDVKEVFCDGSDLKKLNTAMS